MTPAEIRIKAGTNRRVRFTMPVGFDVANAAFELSVKWSGGRRDYSESAGLTKAGQTVTWSYSVADSRAFPEGRVAVVELQWALAGVQDSDTAYLNVSPGISND